MAPGTAPTRGRVRGSRSRVLGVALAVVVAAATSGVSGLAQDVESPAEAPARTPGPVDESSTPASEPPGVGSTPGGAADPRAARADTDARGVAGGLTLAAQPPAGWPAVPVATARAVMAIDATTGQVLALDNVDDRAQVASTIKLLTALTALEVLAPEERITVGPEVEIEGSTAALDPGDTWTVRDLVAGALVRSGNDAAEALAVAAGGGDRDRFLAMMNERAESLGIDGATIADPTGLEDVNLLSARDLALIGRAALADPLVAEIAASRFWDLPSTGVVPNRNLLLEQREDATGLKTGTTDLAGASLVGSVRDGEDASAHDLVAAVVGTRNDAQRYVESNAVFDWIDTAFERHPLTLGARVRLPGEWGGEVTTVDLWAPAEPTVTTTLSIDGSSVVSEVSLPDGGRLGEFVATAEVSPPTSIGQSITATLYDGMRQAHELGRWPG